MEDISSLEDSPACATAGTLSFSSILSVDSSEDFVGGGGGGGVPGVSLSSLGLIEGGGGGTLGDTSSFFKSTDCTSLLWVGSEVLVSVVEVSDLVACTWEISS